MNLDCFEQVKELTKELVKIPSVVREKNGGESKVAKYIYDYYNKLEYFKDNPNQLIYQKTIDDDIDRHNCISIVRGTKGNSNKTIILMGHIDTVGIEDFRDIKEYANDPDKLVEKLRKMDLDPKVRKDLESGEYMFGRGSLDMKSGVAGHMILMKYFSENRDELDGNIVHIAECDEEDGSRGIISALKILIKFRDKYDLEYIAAINADYSTTHYENDNNRYVYLGTIGKLLPSYYIFGTESHVGNPFGAFDPNLLIAETTRKINLNPDLTEEFLGERTLPPISLKQTDEKIGYTVQTALSSLSYYNFFTHKSSPREIIEISKKVGDEAFEDIIDILNTRYRIYCEKIGEEGNKLPWKKRIYTWEEYQHYMKDKYGNEFIELLEKEKEELNKEYPDMDMRDFSTKIIERIWNKYEDNKVPTMIIFYGSIYSAPIAITGNTKGEQKLLASVNAAIKDTQELSDKPLVTKYFYPYISDSSFMAIDDDNDGIKALEENMPCWRAKYTHPTEDIKNINVPVINIGSFGFDGHCVTERVHMNHTFSVVPNITLKTIKGLLI